MFAEQYQYKYASKYTSKYSRRRRPGPKRWLAVFLVCTLVLFSTLDPVPTFSRYMVNLQEMFNLNTSNFYLTPSLGNNLLTYDDELGFTEGTVLTVANNSGSQVTTHNMLYTITLSEAGPNPLFDLYLDDGQGVKTLCQDNVINGSLVGGSAHSNSYTVCLGLKDESNPPASGSYVANLILSSSEPYIRSYTFNVSIQIEDQGMIEIPGTEIERPNVEIPEGEIMVFLEEEFQYLTVEDLLNPLVVDAKVDELGRPDLVGGSLYVPASAGDLLVDNWDENIEWDVAGHIILEPDILVDSYKPVNITSHYGDVILNNTTIAGDSQPYQVNITAEEGNIEANGATIISRSSAGGVISLAAQHDINLDTADISSAGDSGVHIISVEGTINASNADIVSTNGSTNADIIIQTAGFINLDGATVSSNGSPAPPAPALLIKSTADGISAKNATLTSNNSSKLLEIAAQGFIDLEQTTISSQGALIITTLGDISARSANISNAGWDRSLEITSTGGMVDIAALEVVGISQTIISCASGNIKIHASGDINAISTKMTTGHSSFLIELISSAGQIDLSSSAISGVPITDITSAANIYIEAYEDILCITSKITASTKSGKELRFVSTGVGSKLWVDNANLVGRSILAVGLQIEGVPANGNIQ